MIKRTLADLSAGKNVRHLTSEDVRAMIAGLEQRLVVVTAALSRQARADYDLQPNAQTAAVEPNR